MSNEKRARELLETELASRSYPPGTTAYVAGTAALRAISSALQERDGVIEECAAVADRINSCGEMSDYASGYDAAARTIADEILRLKELVA